MRDNYPLWRKTLRDLGFIDLIMILILIFVMGFCWYVHEYGPDARNNQEVLK